jgi:hypothetical protein
MINRRDTTLKTTGSVVVTKSKPFKTISCAIRGLALARSALIRLVAASASANPRCRRRCGTVPESRASTYCFADLERVEASRRPKPRRAPFTHQFAGCREIIARRVYRSHWGVPNFMVLTLTTEEKRLEEMLGNRK